MRIRKYNLVEYESSFNLINLSKRFFYSNYHNYHYYIKLIENFTNIIRKFKQFLIFIRCNEMQQVERKFYKKRLE